jgi:hypothetical protein
MDCDGERGSWWSRTWRDHVARTLPLSMSLMMPRKPLQRAYQREPEATTCWQRETYPAIARQAKRDKADIYCWE